MLKVTFAVLHLCNTRNQWLKWAGTQGNAVPGPL